MSTLRKWTTMTLRLGLLALSVLAFGTANASAEPFAYIANVSDDTVSVIDIATHQVVATVGVGDAPAGVAASPDGTSVYVTSLNSATVWVIDTASYTVKATVPVGDGPSTVAVSPDGTSAYVTNYLSGDVSVIDTLSNVVTATVPTGRGAHHLAVTPDGRLAYVTNLLDNNISVIDTATNTLLTTIPVQSFPRDLAVSPNGAFAYVAQYGASSVAVIDTATNTVTTNVPLNGRPSGVVVTPDGEFVYVAMQSVAQVAVIATANNTIVRTIAVGDAPWSVDVTPDGRFVYVVNAGDETVSVIETATTTVMATLPVGSDPLMVGRFIGPGRRHAPTAVDDSYSTSEDMPLTIGAGGLLANDADLDGDALTAARISGPSHGTLSLNADGGFTYTPSPSFTGTDSFTYQASDGQLVSNPATVTIQVRYQFSGFFQPVDNLPIVNRVTAGQGIPLKFSLTGYQGLSIFTSGAPFSQPSGCSGSAPVDDIATTTAASAAGLQYEAGSDTYTYVWKTDKSWKSTCRQLTVRLDDGSTRILLFQFK
jgi:YVTN family beta-propeller protein/VCBS repeat-containing protein